MGVDGHVRFEVTKPTNGHHRSHYHGDLHRNGYGSQTRESRKRNLSAYKRLSELRWQNNAAAVGGGGGGATFRNLTPRGNLPKIGYTKDPQEKTHHKTETT